MARAEIVILAPDDDGMFALLMFLADRVSIPRWRVEGDCGGETVLVRLEAELPDIDAVRRFLGADAVVAYV